MFMRSNMRIFVMHETKILDKYNMFSLISSTLDSIPAKLDKEKLLLSPMRLSVFDRIRNRIYRLFY